MILKISSSSSPTRRQSISSATDVAGDSTLPEVSRALNIHHKPLWHHNIADLTCLAAGLSVHMNQVHKETLSLVENALPNRQGLDVEIFGMEGLPEEVRKQHEERIVKNYFDAQRERFEATGNPPPGEGRPTKKIKIETPEELKKRFADFRAKKAAAKAAGINGAPVPVPGSAQSPGQTGSPGTSVSVRSWVN